MSSGSGSFPLGNQIDQRSALATSAKRRVHASPLPGTMALPQPSSVNDDPFPPSAVPLNQHSNATLPPVPTPYPSFGADLSPSITLNRRAHASRSAIMAYPPSSIDLSPASTLFTRCTHTSSGMAVVPRSSFSVDLSSADAAAALVRRPLDGIYEEIILTETRDKNDSIVPSSSKGQHERVASLPVRQDTLPTSVDVSQFLGITMAHAPVTRLPAEILMCIFRLCVVHGDEMGPVPVAAQEPFYLAQVCGLWRAIVVSYPPLWTSLQFYFSDSHQNRDQDVSKVKPVLDVHLERSGTLPISLTFTDHRIYHATTEDLVSLLVDRLRTHARRWQRISFQLSCGYFPLLFTFTPCDLSALKYLSISGDVLAQRILTTLHLSLESATNLKSFTYSGPGHSVDDRLHLDWKNLAEVSFEFAPHRGGSSTLSRQFRQLAQCQNITTCSLGIDQPFRPGSHRGQTIILPSLQTLRVRRLSAAARAGIIIGSLILPQLETLEIDASVLLFWNSRWHEGAFSNLLVRSKCALRHLSVQDVDFPSDELVRCLTLSPELTSFRFIPWGPRSQSIVDLIQKLCVSHSAAGAQGHGEQRVAPGPLTPQLRQLELASSVEEHLGLMMEMFRSRVGGRARAAGVTALRRTDVVLFDMWHDTDADDRVNGARLARLAAFQADLARWVSEENKNENENEDDLEASVVVDSPYLAEYIDVQQGRQ